MDDDQHHTPCPIITTLPSNQRFSSLCYKHLRLISFCLKLTFPWDRSWTCCKRQCCCWLWKSCKCKPLILKSSATSHSEDPIWNPPHPTHQYFPCLKTWKFYVRIWYHKYLFMLRDVWSFCPMCSCWQRCSWFMIRQIIVVGWLHQESTISFHLAVLCWGYQWLRYLAFIGWDFETCYELKSYGPRLRIISQMYFNMSSHQQLTIDWSSHALSKQYHQL